MIARGCGGNCNQGRAACDCAPNAQPSRGLPVIVILRAAAPLIALALTGCARVSTDDRVQQLEQRLQEHEAAGCRPAAGEIEPEARRERATSMAAKRGGRDA